MSNIYTSTIPTEFAMLPYKNRTPYMNRIYQLKKERELGKHYGSNKAVGKSSRGFREYCLD